jgi:hypothetical protein
MSRRFYRNGQATSLTAPVDAVSTSITVSSATSFPTQFPYTLILDPDGVLEEVVDVTTAVGNTLTIVRGVDGTTASPHSAGVQVYHGVSARDADEANDHINKTTNVHGTSGSLVDTASTQSIAGAKTFTGTLATSGGTVVDTGSTQTISGSKTFSSAPTMSNGQTVSGAETHNGTETHNGSETHNGAVTYTNTETHNGSETHTGTETHSGAVTFSNGITMSGGTFVAKDAIWSSTYSGTVDTNGFLTITHGAGFTPVYGWTVTSNPSTSFAVFWGMDNITSTQLRLRFMNANGGPLNGLAVVGRLFLARP